MAWKKEVQLSGVDIGETSFAVLEILEINILPTPFWQLQYIPWHPALEEISAFAFVDISIRMYYYQNVIFIFLLLFASYDARAGIFH